MNRSRRAIRVAVGTPPSGLKRWESVEVDFDESEDVLAGAGGRIESAEFECLGRPWRLRVQPLSENDPDSRHKISFSLWNMSDESIEIEYRYIVRVPTTSGVAIHGSGRNKFDPNSYNSDVNHWGAYLGSNVEVVDALEEGTLIIEVMMRYSSAPSIPPSVPFIPGNPFRENILKRFLEEESADVIFEVGGVSEKRRKKADEAGLDDEWNTDDSRELTSRNSKKSGASPVHLQVTPRQAPSTGDKSGIQWTEKKKSLPKEHTDALLARIKKLVGMWAEEEQMNGNNVFYWNIMSTLKMANVATKVPTTLEELAECELSRDIQMQYGDRLIKSINNYIEKESLQQYMQNRLKSADIPSDVGGGGEKGRNACKKARTTANFHAHRVILKDSAPMLAELCNPGNRENPTSVPIAGVDPSIFRQVLYYVYGGKLSDKDLEDDAKEIIGLADKFGMVNLKLEVEARYVKSTTFTIDNILDDLLYADSKNCALLKEAAMDFIVHNRDAILGRASFFNSIPGSMMMDLLAAATRVNQGGDGSGDAGNYNDMRVGTLRKMLHKKGLDVDGSREAMVALLKENS